MLQNTLDRSLPEDTPLTRIGPQVSVNIFKQSQFNGAQTPRTIKKIRPLVMKGENEETDASLEWFFNAALPDGVPGAAEG